MPNIIELAIKIDENTYNHFVRNEYSRVDVIAMHTALVNGTPPKDRSVQDFVDKCRECGKQKSRTYGSRRKYFAYLDGVADGLNESRNDVNSVLDKIRAEVEELPKTYPFVNHIDSYVKEDDVKKIIDKYEVEE